MLDHKGKVAIVTGGAQGIGRGITDVLAENGATTCIADISKEHGNQAVMDLEAQGRKAIFIEADFSKSESSIRVVEECTNILGRLDILVNNAGVSLGGNIDNENFEDVWKATFSVNLDAQMRLIRGCLSDLMRNQDGRIVNIASTEGLGGSARISPYTASKHGVVGLTKALAVELGPMGVTVNAVCPGPIHTGMTDYIPDEDKAEFARRRTALKRFGNPEEVAHITLALVLPSASYITGAAIPVDGGLTARNN